MNTIKNWEQFNEGLISNISKGISKVVKPGELGKVLTEIFKSIKNNFDINQLSKTDHGESEDYVRNYIYNFKNVYGKAGVLKVSNSYGIKCYIDGEDVTDSVNKHLVKDIYDYLDSKYYDESPIAIYRGGGTKIDDIKKKYSKEKKWYNVPKKKTYDDHSWSTPGGGNY